MDSAWLEAGLGQEDVPESRNFLGPLPPAVSGAARFLAKPNLAAKDSGEGGIAQNPSMWTLCPGPEPKPCCQSHLAHCKSGHSMHMANMQPSIFCKQIGIVLVALCMFHTAGHEKEPFATRTWYTKINSQQEFHRCAKRTSRGFFTTVRRTVRGLQCLTWPRFNLTGFDLFGFKRYFQGKPYR